MEKKAEKRVAQDGFHGNSSVEPQFAKMNLGKPDPQGMEDDKVPCPLYVPNELVGDWDLNKGSILFHSYYLSFEGNSASNYPFCDLLLLLRNKLDANVERMRIHLETTSGGVTLQNAYAGSLQLTSDEVDVARKFQVSVLCLLMDRNLDKLNGGINKTVKPNMMYLLLPVDNTTNSQGLTSSIDWTCIRKASPFVKQSHDTSCIHDIKLPNMVQTACGILPLETLQNSIVETPHRKGLLYHVTDVLKHLNANSHMASEKITTGKKKTYIQHFEERGIAVKYPGKPLLRARHLFSLHNFLLRQPQAEKDLTKKIQLKTLLTYRRKRQHKLQMLHHLIGMGARLWECYIIAFGGMSLILLEGKQSWEGRTIMSLFSRHFYIED